ncbi:MAG: tetratricopeptide repeat protein [Planctomycetes bacterium]|nr:tetratricopeptide repeat protein [Planctomycetota bacterium]
MGRKTFGGVLGYALTAQLGTVLTNTLQSKLLAPTGPAPVFSQKQAQQISQTIAKAAQAISDGDFQQAKAHTQELLKRDVNDPTAYHLLGRIAQAEGDQKTAIGHLQRAAELAPQSERIAGDLFVARQLLRSDADVLETASQLVTRKDSALRGQQLLFELAKRTPRQGETYLQLAEGFRTLNLPVQQLGVMGVVLEGGSQDDLKILEGKIKDFIDDNKPVGLAYSLLGRTQQKLGRFDDAMQSLKTAVGIAPEVRRYTEELANVHATLGNIALGKGDLSAAQFRFEIARDLDPLNSDLKFGLAAVFISQGKEKINQGLEIVARSLLGRATALLGSDKSFDKELAVSYFRLGQRALNDGMEGLAQLNFEEAFKRNPDLGGLRRMLTDRYRESGQNVLDAKSYADMTTSDFETVVDNFQKAVDTDPTRSSFKSSLANELNEFGLKLMNDNNDYERALEMFGRARALFPDNATYKSNYEAALDLKIRNPTP